MNTEKTNSKQNGNFSRPFPSLTPPAEPAEGHFRSEVAVTNSSDQPLKPH